jgi:CheY-like chemotaxis protein
MRKASRVSAYCLSSPAAHSPHEETTPALRIRRRRPRSAEQVQAKLRQVLSRFYGHGKAEIHTPRRFCANILTDPFQNMPVMDGLESTAMIRQHERSNNLRPAQICAVTGVTSEEARSNAFNAGVDKYLTKPISMKELTKLVAEARDAEE